MPLNICFLPHSFGFVLVVPNSMYVYISSSSTRTHYAIFIGGYVDMIGIFSAQADPNTNKYCSFSKYLKIALASTQKCF